MNKAKFDPGFAPFVEHFSQNIEVCSQVMNSLNSMHQKKLKYKFLFPQIVNLIKNNVAFYYGCLLWANVLVNENKDVAVELEGNPFSSISKEELENYDFLEEINFIIKYVEMLDRDSKYYLGKPSNIPEWWNQILSIYKEFLEINNGFVSVLKTSDINIPDSVLNEGYDFESKDMILNCIDKKNIELLLETKFF